MEKRFSHSPFEDIPPFVLLRINLHYPVWKRNHRKQQTSKYFETITRYNLCIWWHIIPVFIALTNHTQSSFQRTICCMNYFMIELRLIVNESDATNRTGWIQHAKCFIGYSIYLLNKHLHKSCHSNCIRKREKKIQNGVKEKKSLPSHFFCSMHLIHCTTFRKKPLTSFFFDQLRKKCVENLLRIVFVVMFRFLSWRSRKIYVAFKWKWIKSILHTLKFVFFC